MSMCPESASGRHGPADGAGKCPWCRQKFDLPVLRRKRWANYGEAIDALDRYDGTDPDVDGPEIDEDPADAPDEVRRHRKPPPSVTWHSGLSVRDLMD
jgi:hypothetical protein